MASICVIRAGEFFLQTKLVRHMDRTLVSRNVQDFSSGLVRASHRTWPQRRLSYSAELLLIIVLIMLSCH